MGWPLLRIQGDTGIVDWGCLRGAEIFPLSTASGSIAALLGEDVPKLACEALKGKGLPLRGFEVLSPVTAPCQIICQGKNYLDHLLEMGVKPKDKDFNLLFSKADSSLAPPSGVLRRPSGIRLLDYEIELGLVIGREISGPVEVGEKDLPLFVAGLVLCNDVSARDVQIPERQWFRGKSFRGFCPVGPVFYFMEEHDWASLYSLNLELRVNGKIRQRASTAQLMHRPAETLSLISRTFDLRVGDLLLTGTPGGVSMRVKPKSKAREILDLFMSDKAKFTRFMEEQEAGGRYLKNGDRLEATIRSVDGSVDLGRQELVVEG